MKKLLSLLLILALLITPLAACGDGDDTEDEPAEETVEPEAATEAPQEEAEDEEEPEEEPEASSAEAVEVTVGVLNGNTGVSAAWLMEQAELGLTEDSYTFSTATSPDDMAARLTSGEVQIAALATNVAANLYNKSDGQVQLAAICAYGVLYILENGEEIGSIADLAGRTIHTTGQGANPEYVLTYVLEQNGLTPGEDVEIEYHDNEELSTLMAAGEIDLAMMPEPMVTTVLSNNEDVRVALDMTDEWDAVSEDSSLVMSCIAVRTDFAEENPEAVARFLELYSQSVEETNANPAEVAELVAKYEIISNATIAEKAIPGCNLTYIAGSDMQGVIEGYYQVLFDANPDSIGGAMPDADFYYIG